MKDWAVPGIYALSEKFRRNFPWQHCDKGIGESISFGLRNQIWYWAVGFSVVYCYNFQRWDDKYGVIKLYTRFDLPFISLGNGDELTYKITGSIKEGATIQLAYAGRTVNAKIHTYNGGTHFGNITKIDGIGGGYYLRYNWFAIVSVKFGGINTDLDIGRSSPAGVFLYNSLLFSAAFAFVITEIQVNFML